MTLDLIKLLKFGVDNKASDLHLSAGVVPLFRMNGDIKKVNFPVLSSDDVRKQLQDIMTEAQKKEYDETNECDFAFDLEGVARFRVNAFVQNRGPGAVFRTIPSKVLSLDDLNAPPIFSELMKKPKGLILVTGPTGSGKSTTLAAMIDYYNEKFNGHILTVEDPIEFVHESKKSLVNQREVGSNTLSFNAALKASLREDPDLILVGELRDLETIRLALTAAETGHLVLGTLHSSSASKTINRIIDVFPETEKEMVRTMLSESIQAIVSQSLLKTKDGKSRVAAHEIMIGTNAIRNLIRENKIPQMYSSIQTGQREGMQTLDQCLKDLVAKGIVNKSEAEMFAVSPL
jgi:twitching motility protein PilT